MRVHPLLAIARVTLVAPLQAGAAECDGDPTSETLEWRERFRSRIADTWKRGSHEVLLSGYSWHTPWTYTKDKRDEREPNAWGAG